MMDQSNKNGSVHVVKNIFPQVQIKRGMKKSVRKRSNPKIAYICFFISGMVPTWPPDHFKPKNSKKWYFEGQGIEKQL